MCGRRPVEARGFRRAAGCGHPALRRGRASGCVPAIPQSRRSRDSSLYTREPLARRGRGAGGHVGPPLREDGESDEPTGLVFAAVWRRGVEDAAPYGVPADGGAGRASAPTKGMGGRAVGDAGPYERDGGCGSPRRPVGPPRNDRGCHSKERSDVPKVWLPPGKFGGEIRGCGYEHWGMRRMRGSEI